MSLLVILLPARERLASRSPADAAPAARSARAPESWRWLLADDGAERVQQSGHSAAALLPRAAQAVLVLAEGDVAWHAVAVPKAPPARLRAALAGVLEDALLDEPDTLHLALGANSAPGRDGWVAATDAPRLRAALAALEAAGCHVERVVPMAVPGPARGHFHAEQPDGDGESIADETHPWLTLADERGTVRLRTDGSLLRHWLTPERLADTRWSASPVAAIAAERLLGRPVALLGDGERALEAVRSATDSGLNLRQFELASRRRGTRAVGALAKRLLSPEWRGARWGLAALVAVMAVGLNVQAWQLRRTIDERKATMAELLKATHPGVNVVLDAPLQMQRETERLRAAAGRAGAADLEALLAAAAGAWPDGTGPVQTLRFDSGSLTLAAVGWAAPQVQQFRDRLRGAGYAAEFAEGRVVVSRLRAGQGLS
jgi:general secretion pathway protein L